MASSTYRLISGVGVEQVIHVEAPEAKALVAAVTAEFLAMLNVRPVMNHSCRIVLPQGQELRGLRATRWLTENT